MDLARQCAIEMNEDNDDNILLSDDFGDFFDVDFFFTKNLETKKRLSQEQRKQIWLKIGICFFLNNALNFSYNLLKQIKN